MRASERSGAAGRLQTVHFTSGKWYAPGGIRTPDLRIRSPLLYPTELRAHLMITDGYMDNIRSPLNISDMLLTRGNL